MIGIRDVSTPMLLVSGSVMAVAALIWRVRYSSAKRKREAAQKVLDDLRFR